MALPNTHYGEEKIAEILDGKKNLFFDGIGGVSMNSLAHISHLRGYNVSGYDRTPSEITHKLENMGIKVYYEAKKEHVADCDALIYTVAMPEDNDEYAYAGEHGIPRISRADYLGYLMMGYKNRIGVSGCHGKSTTTGLIAHILKGAGKDPTAFNGATMKETGSVDMIGGHGHFVFEACEYMDSFLDFNPTVAVVLNIELDHVDYFKSIDQMRASFAAFMNITGKDGHAVYNLNDENCVKAASGYCGNHITFGRNNRKAVFYSENEMMNGGYAEFDIVEQNGDRVHVRLNTPGEHMIDDALAAYAACRVSGLGGEEIAEHLGTYTGVCRRMEKLCMTDKGAVLYSDYAHHPTEIEATLKGARAMCKGRLNVVFQPHTFSRTAELFNDFVRVFAESGADEVLLCDIYQARETNIYGVTSAALMGLICKNGKKCRLAKDFCDAADKMYNMSGEGDMMIVMGAGDIIEVAEIIKKKYSRE